MYAGLVSGTKTHIPVSKRVRELSRMHRESLLFDYMPLTYAILLNIDRDFLQDKITVRRMATQFSPADTVVFKLVWLLALDNKKEEAVLALRRAVATHPGYIPTAQETLATLVSTFPKVSWLSTEFNSCNKHRKAVIVQPTSQRKRCSTTAVSSGPRLPHAFACCRA